MTIRALRVTAQGEVDAVDLDETSASMIEAVGSQFYETSRIDGDLWMWATSGSLFDGSPINPKAIQILENFGEQAQTIHGDVVFTLRDREGLRESLDDETISKLTAFAESGT
jgi:hypothetical protein